MATSTNSLIRVTDVCKEYNGGSVHALSHCNLSVKKGEVVAIIGPSGSGKSTLLRCLNLLEQPTSGTIYFKDVALNGKKVNLDLHRREMGMVFQHFNLFPHMTVKKNITLAPVKLGLKSQAEADEQASVTGRAEDQNQYEDAFQDCRILMAEDNEINAEIAIEILGEMGAQVEGVENGRLAVEAFENHPENWYDLILMDVQMPEMDGRTAARTIRALDRADAKTIPIFALSADAFVEDERLSIQSGMNGHFAKPVDFTMLQQAIGVYLAKRKRKE